MNWIFLLAVSVYPNQSMMNQQNCARVGSIVNAIVARELGQGEARFKVTCQPASTLPGYEAGIIAVPQSSLPVPPVGRLMPPVGPVGPPRGIIEEHEEERY